MKGGGSRPGRRKKPKCDVGLTKLWHTLGRDGRTGVLYSPSLSHLALSWKQCDLGEKALT